MKKALAFFTLLLGLMAMFAQSGPTFPYQAVVRNSQNQLIKDSTFAVDVEIYQGATLKYSETQSVTTNANGQFTMNIGGGAVVSGAMNDIADWSVAKFKLTYHLSEGDIVSENAVSPVPYALQAANAIGTISGNFLTSDSTVITTMQANIAANANDIAALANRVNTFNTNVCDSVSTCVGNAIDAHNFLTSDSAVITTMQSDIATNTTNITTNATDIATNATNIAANANDIAALANRVNTFNTNVCDSVATCVGNAIDAHNFLTSDSAVITTMQSEIAALQAASLDCNDVKNCIADTLNAYTPTTQLCDAVKDCDFSGNTSIANLLQTLSDQIAAQNRVVDSLAHIVDSLSNITPSSPGGGDNTCCSELGARLDSLAHIVDSLSALPHGGGDTPTEVADGQPCPGDPTVSDVGGNTYNTVKIGNQCWMKENLRTNVDGSVYPKKNSSTELTADERVTYGRLYTWTAMMNGEGSSNNVPSGVQGICPTGWHVPSDAEWDTLTHYVYNSANPDYKCSGCSSSVWEQSTKCIAKALSSTTGWNSSSSDGCYAGNTGAKANATGFAAVPAGYCFLGSSSYFGDEAYFWSATQSGDYLAWCRFLSGNDSYVTRYDANKGSGYSVRCLRDAGIGGGTNPSTPGEVSCEQVMECMADTLSRLNARITSQGETIAAQGAEIETLNGTVTTQGETITAQGNTIDSLAHIVDSLSNLTPVNPDTPTGSFTCGTSKVKDAQNNEYNTVKIGNQCWTKENLKTTSSIGATYYPNNQAATVGTYGLLYDWAAAMQVADAYTTMIAVEDKHQGICPTGWHVPSDAEWDTLTKYVYNSANPDYKCSGCESSVWEQSTKCIAKALSSTTGWNSNTSEGCNAGNKGDKANATGFASVPAGGCFIDRFDDFGDRAYCWSATQYNVSLAWCRGLDGGDSSVYRDYYYDGFGFSVRCLRDAGIGGTPGSNETGGGTNPSTPGEVSCEQVMECMADTLGALNARIESQGTEIETLNSTVTAQGTTITTQGETITAQGETIDNLNNTVTTQGQTIDSLNNVVGSLSHVVDSLSNLPHGGGDTPATFTCGTSKVKDVDNNEYNTVKIGSQCWMKENLRTKTSAYGNVWTNPDVDSTIYGRYYDWEAVMQNESGDKVQGICPTGWHVPSDAEWTQLTTYVKSVSEYVCDGCSGTDNQWYTYCIAKALSQPTGWSNTGTGCNAGNTGDKANLTGFSAVPAGSCFDGYFYFFGSDAYFWSATRSGVSHAWYRYLLSNGSAVGGGYDSKDLGLSVRCLRDAGIGGGDEPSEPDTPVTPTDTFNCGTDKVSDVDGNEYNTVQIGNQCWTKENLKTNTHTYGNVYGVPDLVSTYGRYYDWEAAMQVEGANTTNVTVGDKHQGICPNGWHVPSQAEWDTLTKYTFDNYKCDDCEGSWAAGGAVPCIAKALASPLWTGGEPNSCYPNTTDNDKNATGFSALPAGVVFGYEFEDLYRGAGFWSTTQYDNSKAYYHFLTFNEEIIGSVSNIKYISLSVRCLRDAGIGGGDEPSEPSEPDTPVTPTDTFNCGTDKVKDVQNNEYNTVQIGNQCWTKENMKTTKYANGTDIDAGKMFNPDNNANNVATYGLLYTWSAATRDSSTTYPADGQVKVQGICPAGWHVPSDAEWDTLTHYVFNSTSPDYKCGSSCGYWSAQSVSCIANALSSTTGWNNPYECCAGHSSATLNATGFAAVPAGHYLTGNYIGFSDNADFWSATQSDDNSAWCRDLFGFDSRVCRSDDRKDYGYSVRCLRD